MNAHAHIDRWSLAMHRHIADRIESGDETPVRIARANLERWALRHGELAPALGEWIPMLTGPRAQLLHVLRDDTQHATRMRSSSPFAGAIDQQLRLELFRETRAA